MTRSMGYDEVTKVTVLDPDDICEGVKSVFFARPYEVKGKNSDEQVVGMHDEEDDEREYSEPHATIIRTSDPDDINWCAPEMLARHGLGLHSDVFAYAIIVSALAPFI